MQRDLVRRILRWERCVAVFCAGGFAVVAIASMPMVAMLNASFDMQTQADPWDYVALAGRTMFFLFLLISIIGIAHILWQAFRAKPRSD